MTMTVVGSFARRELREPGTGAHARRLPRIGCDGVRALTQLAGTLADFLGPSQTGWSCLGVKGSRVQIPPSRLSSLKT
jgi:hypothetical protein